MKNPYPKGSLNHELFELGVALSVLGHELKATWPYRLAERVARWILRLEEEE